jgi:hypothetical protein
VKTRWAVITRKGRYISTFIGHVETFSSESGAIAWTMDREQADKYAKAFDGYVVDLEELQKCWAQPPEELEKLLTELERREKRENRR